MAPVRPSGIEVDKRSWTGRRTSIRVLSALTVIGVLLGVAGILVPRFFSHADGSAAADRQQVVSRTEAFAKTYNTYDVKNAADYQKRMKGLLTNSYDKEFVKVTDSIFTALVSRKQTSGDAKVLDVAVDSIDKDSAVALVAVDAAISNTDNKAAVQRHLRWKVSLVKQNGQWNIDKFESVASLQAEAGQPSATPSAQPSAGSTAK